MSPRWWGVWGGGLRGPQIWGAGVGVLDLGVLMRRGVWVGGLRDPQIWGAGLGVLGLDVPTVVGSAGWGSEGPPNMGGWVGGFESECSYEGRGGVWGGGLRDPQIWGAGLGVLNLGVLMKRGV